MNYEKMSKIRDVAFFVLVLVITVISGIILVY
jgi:hypothetical protein